MVLKKNDEINKKLFFTPIKSACKSGIFNSSSKKSYNNNSNFKIINNIEVKSNFKSINTIISSEIKSLENDWNIYKNTLDRIIIKENNLKSSIDELALILDDYEKELNF